MYPAAIKTSVLLEILIENREKHKREYEEAVEGYRVDALNLLMSQGGKLVELFAKWKSLLKDPKCEAPELSIPCDLWTFDIQRPKSHLPDYDLAIKTLRLVATETVSLSRSEVSFYVDDNWAWKESFVNISNAYKGKSLALNG